jgi:hypothetical protein
VADFPDARLKPRTAESIGADARRAPYPCADRQARGVRGTVRWGEWSALGRGRSVRVLVFAYSDARIDAVWRDLRAAIRACPSTLAVVGRYVLTPRIFHHLETAQPGAGGEIQLTDAISALLAEQQVLAYRYQGVRYDCGSKLGYLQATVEYALRHSEVGGEFATYLRSLGRLP